MGSCEADTMTGTAADRRTMMLTAAEPMLLTDAAAELKMTDHGANDALELDQFERDQRWQTWQQPAYCKCLCLDV